MDTMSELGQKELDVTLDLTSHTLSLPELQSAIGMQGDAGSHSRGDSLPGGRTAAVTILRVASGLAAPATLIEHLHGIRVRVSADRLRQSTIPVEATLTIGVFFATASASVLLDREALELVGEYGAKLEVVCYPTAP